jgi:hypothetical protein
MKNITDMTCQPSSMETEQRKKIDIGTGRKKWNIAHFQFRNENKRTEKKHKDYFNGDRAKKKRDINRKK